MKDFKHPWFIAGGWAIDLFLGQETRPHSDIEIGVYRHHQSSLKKHLEGWTFLKVNKANILAWEGERLELPVHELYAIKQEQTLEILLSESSQGDWVFRRDPAITVPYELAWAESSKGIPYLQPEIVLLYKVNQSRKKDHHDFFETYKHLDVDKRKWLRKAVSHHEPYHDWLNYL